MTISYIISTLAELAILAIIIRSILSWVTGVPSLLPVIRFFDSLTDPIILPIRRRMPLMGGFDFSPMIAILLIWIAENILLVLLAGR